MALQSQKVETVGIEPTQDFFRLLPIIITLVLTFAAPARAAIIFQPNYQTADPIAAGWGFVEAPYDSSGVTQPSRIRLEGNNLRVELRPGDRYTSPNGYTVPRAEVRMANPTKSTPATSTAWKFCESCERWTRERIYLPPDFPLTTDGLKWLVATQFKGLVGGSPPEAIEIKRSTWQFVHDGSRYDLYPVQPGATVQIEVGMFMSPDPTLGWYEVYVTPADGVRRLAVPRTYGSTMDRYWDSTPGVWVTDQVYLKNGWYRASSWDSENATHIGYFGAPLITDARPF